MNPPSPISDNLGLIDQARNLLARIPDERYAAAAPPVAPNGVGPHLRHVLDHYEAFLRGWSSGRIDYDDRERDPRVETDREAAAQALDLVSTLLAALPPDAVARGVRVRLDTGGSSAWTESSVNRELSFLVSHTVHHFAIIAMILRLGGIEPEPGFGVAPSTLHHQARLAACAP